jgi:hypothetical protein
MRFVWIAALCFSLTTPALTQTSDADPPSRDDILLYMRTMHSHDLIEKMMEVQGETMRKMFRDLAIKKNGSLPSDFDTRFKKSMDELIRGMPMDEMTQAAIPAYQHHFTKGDIAAMNTFYSSPVGQKVLAELPEVTREASQEMMPILTKYISEWKDRTEHQFEGTGSDSPGR